MGRGDLTDAQWAVLEPLLPKGKKTGPADDMDPATTDRRHTVADPNQDAQDVPERYGPWGRAYDLFRRWQRDGIWQRVFTELQARADGQDLITWDLNVDSTIVRAHQHAAGARKRGICKRNRPAASSSSRTTMGSGAPAAA